MLDPIQIEIHIEQRPKKMLAVMKFDRKTTGPASLCETRGIARSPKNIPGLQ